MEHSRVRRNIRLAATLAVLFLPSLAQAQVQQILESPANGALLSGLGFISGWKCEAGTITVKVPIGGTMYTLPVAWHQPRADTNPYCGDDNNGFIAQINWNFLGTGEHTVVAYDDSVEFARSTFTVVQASEEGEFLTGVTAECTVPDFPDMGTNASFEWNESTQHLELAEVGEDVVVPVSTRFDGEWDFVMEVTGSVFDQEICDCYGGATFLSVENGETSLGWNECEQQEWATDWFAIISPTGQLESSFGQYDAEGHFFPYGSLDGFLFDDGTGGGRWIHVYGCVGTWSVQRREDS